MSNEVNIPEILVSVDGEFTGPTPMKHSMISLGCVAYTEDGNEISRFKVNIKELIGHDRDAQTMEWWTKQGDAWDLCQVDQKPPWVAMEQFADWLESLPGEVQVMAWPISADFQFIYGYCITFLGYSPFGYDGIDIKTYAMRALNIKYRRDVSCSVAREALGIENTEFGHDPTDDAAQQAEIFFGLKKL